MSNTSEDSDVTPVLSYAKNENRRRSYRRRTRDSTFPHQMSDSSSDEVDSSSTIESDDFIQRENLVDEAGDSSDDGDVSSHNDTEEENNNGDIAAASGDGDDSLDNTEEEDNNEDIAAALEVRMENELIQDGMEVGEVSSGEASNSASDLESAGDSVHNDEDDERAESEPDNRLSDESFESDSDNSDNGVDEDRLFVGSRLSLGEHMLALQALSMRHKLTGVCLNDLLTFIEMLSPPDNKCVKSLYKFKKYFITLGTVRLIYHYYCSTCMNPLESEDQACEHCAGHQEVNYFLEIPVIQQLQRMFLRPGFYEALQYRFQRVKKFEGNIEDVWDGNIYKEQMQNNGFLSDCNNLSFMWYTDGIAIYKSSQFSVWPMYLINNEMKYKERTKRENIILAGLWYGASKPEPNVFLEPLNNELDQLGGEGHVFERPGGPPIRVRAKMLLGTGDLQAKCRFMCCRQWNGFFGCLKCYIRGVRYFLNERSVHVYPFSPNVDLRSNDDVPGFAAQALRNRQYDPDADVYGVKALSRLYFMLPNMILCMAIDSMHGLSGVMKTVTNLWLDPAFVGSPFSVHHLSNVIDYRLKTLRPPDFVQKMPELVSDFAQWKCLDYKLFFLYYSLPILINILPENYWHHHCRLVSAVASLMQESVSLEEINEARDLLNSYVADFQELYGLRHMTMNIHQLSHFPDDVENLGPLWVYDCFFLEDLNGHIASLVHGSRHAGLQISSSVMAFLSFPARLEELGPDNPVRLFCRRILASGQRHVKIAFRINPYMYGASSLTSVEPVELRIPDILAQDCDVVGGRRRYFSRLMKKNVLYIATRYRYVQKLSCYAHIRHNGIHLGKILHFVKWTPCNDLCPPQCEVCPGRYFFIVETYNEVPWEVHDVLPNVRMMYLKRVEPAGFVRAFPVESESTLCFYLAVDGREYIAAPVNTLQIE